MPQLLNDSPKLGNRKILSLGLADWILLGLFACFLLLMCVIRSRTRLLWTDELLGDRLLNESSFPTMLRGWWEGADGGGPLYYLLGRIWVTFVGHGALSLRLFSTVGMILGLLCVWSAARRYVSTISVAWSTALVFLYASAPRWQEVNGRFYGFFFAAATFASLMFLVTEDDEITGTALSLTAAAHVLLVGSHILGFVYSLCLTLTMVVRDRAARHVFRWKLYTCAASSWLMLTVSWHAIYRSTSIAKGVFWTQKPGRNDLLLGLAAFDQELLEIGCFLLLLILVKLLAQGRLSHALRYLAKRSLLWLCFALCSGQMLLFTKSRFGLSLYANRYLIPLLVVTTLFFALSLEEMFGFRKWTRQPFWTCIVALVLMTPCAAYALKQRDLNVLYPQRGLPERMSASLPRNAAVLVTLMPDFVLMSKYDPSRKYYFLLDWPYDLAALKKQTIDLSGQREMENWHNAGLLPGRIIPCPAVFQNNDDLYILLDPGRADWMNVRLLHNPDYVAQKVLNWSEWYPYALWHVRHLHPGPCPC